MEKEKTGATSHRGEFYSTKEYNTTSEYCHFPAEIYLRPNEENPSAPENAPGGKEVTTLQPKIERPSKGVESRELAQKMFRSVKSVATVATVSAALVVTGSLATAPTVEPIAITCGDTFITYQVEVKGLEENVDYTFALYDGAEEVAAESIEENGVYHSTVEGLKPNWEYTLLLLESNAFAGKIQHFEAKVKTLGTPLDPIPPPKVEIEELSIADINLLRMDFSYADLPEQSEVSFVLQSGDTSVTVTATEKDLQTGYLFLPMESGNTVSVTPIVSTEEDTVTLDSFTHSFTETLLADITVGLDASQIITFYVKGITSGAEWLQVTSSLDPENPEMLWVENVAQVSYREKGIVTYTLCLVDENGEPLSNTVSFTVDTSISMPDVDYHFTYYNTGDVGVSYNSDGTVNVYIPTEFSSADERLYYQVLLGSIRYTSKEPLAKIEGIPDTNYALRYSICMEIDGIEYALYSQTPSGTVNESYFYLNGELTDNTLFLELYPTDLYLDLNTVRLLSSGGEEYLLSEADFTYNEDRGSYDVTVTFSQSPEWVTVQAMANPYYASFMDTISYQGNPRKIFEATVEQP